MTQEHTAITTNNHKVVMLASRRPILFATCLALSAASSVVTASETINSTNQSTIVCTSMDYLRYCNDVNALLIPSDGITVRPDFKSRYQQFSESEWFKKVYKGKGLGEIIEIAD